MPKRVAFGLKARTGRAVLVAIGGDLQQPQFKKNPAERAGLQ